jgi:hypothetical protein
MNGEILLYLVAVHFFVLRPQGGRPVAQDLCEGELYVGRVATMAMAKLFWVTSSTGSRIWGSMCSRSGTPRSSTSRNRKRKGIQLYNFSGNFGKGIWAEVQLDMKFSSTVRAAEPRGARTTKHTCIFSSSRSKQQILTLPCSHKDQATPQQSQSIMSSDGQKRAFMMTGQFRFIVDEMKEVAVEKPAAEAEPQVVEVQLGVRG